MSSRLDLPPERDLPTGRRRELRAELVRATRPVRRRRRRAWVLVVPFAVLAVAVGLGLSRPWDRTSPVVGLPSPSPSVSGTPAPPPSPTPSVPAAEPIDRGALSSAESTRVIERCERELGRLSSVATVHFARRTSTDGAVVLFTGRDGVSYLCGDLGAQDYSGPGSSRKDLRTPDAQHPVVRVLEPGFGDSATGRSRRSTTQAPYRVGPEVVSLQMRLTVDGHVGPWFEASRSGGWAWAGAEVSYTDPRKLDPDADVRVEDRAFDADGNELAIDRTPR